MINFGVLLNHILMRNGTYAIGKVLLI